MNPILLTDYYKTEHYRMYPENMTQLYSNFTARKSRIEGCDSIVFFGLQHFIREYLIKKFTQEFFFRPWSLVEDEYKFAINTDISHIKALHELGYLPIKIKAVEEGTQVPIGVPCMTVVNTHPAFGWLTNYLETLISCQLWQPITSATIAHQFKKLLDEYAIKTTGNADGVQWQGHDFSMRGMSSVESAILSGMGHLTSFTGTDTIPAIYALRRSYYAEGLIGASVPATEHSVMCMGQKESEIKTFQRLLRLYPTGILSVVSDTWDLWKVLTEYLPQIKDEIMARDGKLVIRPDSGNPVDIICGKVGDIESARRWPLGKGLAQEGDSIYVGMTKIIKRGDIWELHPEHKGVIELLWDVFGGTVNEQGYKVLDPHVGAIYGDSIDMRRAKEISERLITKGFASTNIVYGIGSYTYQYNTRDTFGFAMKATYGEVNGEGREIFKDPVTDDGTKKSKKGLLRVDYQDGKLVCFDQQTAEQEKEGILKEVFVDGVEKNSVSLQSIRNKLK